MMKIVILAGGLGTRLAEETDVKPKPMVEIGGKPLLWHIMKHYAAQGFSEFFIALGYRGDVIKRFFLDYVTLSTNMTVHLSDGVVEPHGLPHDDWTVHLVDTGLEAATGGRLGRLRPWLEGERFMLTYGDGVSNVDLAALLEWHEAQNRIATITAVRPPARFGGLVFEPDGGVLFDEKPQVGEGWINGGFMVFEPEVFEWIDGDSTVLEADVLEALSQKGQLTAYRHDAFWQCVDTLRELRYLRSLWDEGNAPWVTWADE